MTLAIATEMCMPMRSELLTPAMQLRRASVLDVVWSQFVAANTNLEIIVVFCFCALGLSISICFMLLVPDYGATIEALGG